MFDFVIDGDDDIAVTIDDVAAALNDGAVRELLAESVEELIERARAMSPPDAPQIGQSIGFEVVPAANTVGWTIAIGPQHPGGALGPIFEFGTGPRYHEDGSYAGVMRASPFMRPAWDETEAATFEYLRREVEAMITLAASQHRPGY